MCLTCGCMDKQGVEAANNDHGDQRHLLYNHLVSSALADGITPAEALKRVNKYARQYAKAHAATHGQTVKSLRKSLTKSVKLSRALASTEDFPLTEEQLDKHWREGIVQEMIERDGIGQLRPATPFERRHMAAPIDEDTGGEA